MPKKEILQSKAVISLSTLIQLIPFWLRTVGKTVASELIAYSDQHQLEVLFVTEPALEDAGFDQHFVVRRKGTTEASFPCMAVDILVYLLEHLEEFFERGLKPACSPPERNTALCMGTLWADFHVVEGQEGFTFYEEKKRLTFVSSKVIRALNSFWQLRQAPKKP
jgi:hypothetical protein